MLHADAPLIIVCIPTYKRPEQLKSLLDAVSQQTIALGIGILIGNNDQVSVRDSLSSADSLLFVDEIMVDAKGVSMVRNALIRKALDRQSSSDWIAFIDDDQVPSPDWLQHLVGTGERFGADMVGGPVAKIPVRSGFWARAAASRARPAPEGRVPMLNEAGNLLLSTSYLRKLERPAFSALFGQTGGEDFEFFLYSSQRGAKMCWSPSAHVTEPLPAERTAFKGMLARAYRERAYQARATRLHLGLAPALGSAAKHVVGTPVVALRSLTRDKSLKLAVALVVRRIAGAFGSVAGLLGSAPVAYGQ
jgi:hypothetical protein